MNKHALTLIPLQKDEKKKMRLRATIQRKRTILERLVIKTEMLKVNLDMAKQEYDVKVGNLFLKDSQLDFEIIRLRNILSLMEEGLTHEQAVNKIAETYYAEQLELEREQERIRLEEEMYEKREDSEANLTGDIKKLWKKLIAKFHPDLTQDPREKQNRDAIMKRINRAYQEGDFEQLQSIDQENLSEQEQTIDNLEELLLRVIKEILAQTELLRELKTSEWHDWMLKIDRAKKKHINIFADTERQLLNDIVAKLDLVKALKAQIEAKKSQTT